MSFPEKHLVRNLAVAVALATAALLATFSIAMPGSRGGGKGAREPRPLLACGIYGNTEGLKQRVNILGGGRALSGFMDDEDTTTGTRMFYQQSGNTLLLVHSDTSIELAYRIEANGTLVSQTQGVPTLTLQRSQECMAPSDEPENACLADLKACFAATQPDAPEHVLRQACDAGLEYACPWMLRRMRTLPDPTLKTRLARRELETFPLTDAGLDAAGRWCELLFSELACETAATELWRGQRFEQADAARKRACSLDSFSTFCESNPISTATQHKTTLESVSILAATKLPCGRYVSGDPADIDSQQVVFDASGQADIGDGPVPARIIEGRVHLRNPMYADYVLQPMQDGSLLGMDHLLAFTRFVPAEGARSDCVVAREVVERVPDPDADCRVPDATSEYDAWATCCEAGNLRACNGKANIDALKRDWAAAIAGFTPLCEAHVREACEALTSIAGRGVPEAGQAVASVCEGDPQHVACEAMTLAGMTVPAHSHN